ncbi:hypothetical protein RJT34_08463 [Clitoria ternatea]|uniref:Uncharacterized protein n=1 Tax=Clitoria ternatea TaxID=43366 RepID=A0AAN9K6K2_CLITE
MHMRPVQGFDKHLGVPLAKREIPKWLLNFPISSFAINGAWNSEFIEEYLPIIVMNKFQTCMAPYWILEANGEFSLRSAYMLINRDDNRTDIALLLRQYGSHLSMRRLG